MKPCANERSRFNFSRFFEFLIFINFTMFYFYLNIPQIRIFEIIKKSMIWSIFELLYRSQNFFFREIFYSSFSTRLNLENVQTDFYLMVYNKSLNSGSEVRFSEFRISVQNPIDLSMKMSFRGQGIDFRILMYFWFLLRITRETILVFHILS